MVDKGYAGTADILEVAGFLARTIASGIIINHKHVYNTTADLQIPALREDSR
jgi:hypothetical protein